MSEYIQLSLSASLVEKLPHKASRRTRQYIRSRQPRLKRYIHARDGYACCICGHREVIETHHIIAVQYGGTNDPRNLITLCPTHHRLADGGKLTADFLRSLTRGFEAYEHDASSSDDESEDDDGIEAMFEAYADHRNRFWPTQRTRR